MRENNNVTLLVLFSVLMILGSQVGRVCAAPATYTQSVTYNGETITMQLKLEPLRGAQFEVLVQNATGGYDAFTPVAERSYLGTVDEYPGAVSCGVLRDDGTFWGAVYFDRGVSWYTTDSAVYATRALNYGINDFTTYATPTASTVTPGHAGGNMIAFDVGIDIDNDYYNVVAQNSSATALEMIEYSVNNTRAIYMKDALLRPYLGRVIMRADKTQDPYDAVGGGSYLEALRTEWNTNQTSANRDVVAGVTRSDVGGGLAWVGVMGTSSAYSVNDSNANGAFDAVWRHELGHNWGCGHFVGGSPEGAGLMGGNAPARMTGCEVQVVLSHRDAKTSILDDEGVFSSTSLPPYASMDAVTYAPGTFSMKIDPLANDHDANNDSMSLSSFDATSVQGASITLSSGTGPGGRDELIYQSNSVPVGDDYFYYVVADSTGKSATGVVIVKIDDNAADTDGDGLSNFIEQVEGTNPNSADTDSDGVSDGDELAFGSDPVDAQSVPAVYNQNVLAWWQYSENTGVTASDASAFGNTASLTNVTWVSGVLDSAVELDGVSSEISAGSVAVGSEFTLSAWIKPDALTGDMAIVSQNSSYTFKTNGTNLRFTTPGVKDHNSSGVGLVIGQWQHVVVTFSASQAGGVKFYLNGQLMGTDNASGINANSNATRVGNNQWNQFFDGTIDEVRVYEGIKSGADILSLYESYSHDPNLVNSSLAVAENSPSGTFVGNVTATDPNVGDTLSYAITAGNIGDVFVINANTGDVSLNGAIDYETYAHYNLKVTVTDSSGRTDTATITVNITNIVGDDSDGDGLDDDWEATHFGDTASQSGADDADNDGVSNTAELAAGTNPVNIDTDADGSSDALEITFGTDPLDAQSLPQSHNQGLLAWWRMNEGAGSTASNAIGSNHVVTLTDTTWSTGSSGQGLNFNGTTSEAQSDNVVLDQTITISAWVNPSSLSGEQSIVSKDGAFTFKLSGSGLRFTTPGILDHNMLGAGLVSNTWQHVAITFDSGQTGGAKFYLNGQLLGSVDASAMTSNTNGVELGNNQWNQRYSGAMDEVRVYDKVLSDADILTLYQSPNATPVANNATFSVAENSGIGLEIGTVVATDPGDTLSYTITGGNTGGAFAINSGTGAITTAAALDHETTASYALTVTVTDSGSLTGTATITVNVTNVNEAPTASDTSGSVAEDVSTGTSVATVTATDPDAGDTLTYAITAGNTGGAFAIDSSGNITTATALDYETTASYTLTVTVTDSGSLTDTATVNVTVTDVAEATGPKLVRTTVSNVSSASWTSVNLGQSYNSAVIIATPMYPNSSVAPVVTRIRNVSGSGFEVKLDRTDGQTGTVTMDVSVIAVEEGVYTVASDGVKMEAVRYTSTVTGAKNAWTAENRSYQNSYTTPVVVGQVMSANDADWSAFWCHGSSRTNPPNGSNLNVGKMVAEDPDTTRADETVGYIVIESGSGSMNGINYTAGLGSDTVRGVGQTSVGYNYSLSGLTSASAAAVSLAGLDGGDGGWAVLYGSSPLSSTTLTLAVDEDQLSNSERNHTTEQCGYIVFE